MLQVHNDSVMHLSEHDKRLLDLDTCKYLAFQLAVV